MMTKYPLTCWNTNEIVNSYKEYLKTKHWEYLKQDYLNSKLSKVCQRCSKSNIPYDFHHRTYKRIGKEWLMDIIPLCRTCHYGVHENLKKNVNTRTNLWNVHRKGKKKVIRQQLKGFSFNPQKLTAKEKEWFFKIDPKMRGCYLSKFFSDKVQGFKITSWWINQQVSNACKWIRKEQRLIEESIYQDLDKMKL